jgi:hypothetical protein
MGQQIQPASTPASRDAFAGHSCAQRRRCFVPRLALLGALSLVLAGLLASPVLVQQGFLNQTGYPTNANDQAIRANTQRMMDEGRQAFRSDTFGSEKFFGDTLKLHRAIEGSAHGGVGPGVSPKTAPGGRP